MNKNQAYIEFKKIIHEYNEKADAIIAEAKTNGTWLPGLDGNRVLFREIDKEYKEKVALLSSMINKE